MRRIVTVMMLGIAACTSADAANREEQAAVVDPSLPTVLVYKTPTCGCCNGWIDHMEAAGFAVDARDVRDIISVKMDAGVPTNLSSCHTAFVDGYIVEGHVPIDQVKRLLEERPEVLGIATPGMPIGSPGMEGANPQPYQVFAFDGEGSTSVYANIEPR